MSTRSNRFYFDWWVVEKRSVYALGFGFLLCAMIAGGALYVWKYGNPLRQVGTRVDSPAGARFISFETKRC